MNATKTAPATKAKVINWGGYYAVVSEIPGTDRYWVHAKRFRSYDTAKRSAARINAKLEDVA